MRATYSRAANERLTPRDRDSALPRPRSLRPRSILAASSPGRGHLDGWEGTCSLFVPWRSKPSASEAARLDIHGPVRLRQPRWDEIDPTMHLPSAAGYADPRLDPRTELPALSPGEPAYVPGVRGHGVYPYCSTYPRCRWPRGRSARRNANWRSVRPRAGKLRAFKDAHCGWLLCPTCLSSGSPRGRSSPG